MSNDINELVTLRDQTVAILNSIETLLAKDEEVKEHQKAIEAKDSETCTIKVAGESMEVTIAELKLKWIKELDAPLGSADGWNVKWISGEMFWVLNGQMESIDGHYSAYYPNHKDQKQWHKAGQLHREDGPAITIEGQNDQYALNGQTISEDAWKKGTGRSQMSLDDIPTEMLVRTLAEKMGVKVKDVMNINKRQLGKPELGVIEGGAE